MSDTQNIWAVVGGGIMGMTLAYRFAQQGKKVILFERSKELGGLADAWRVGDVVWDRHYHVISMSDLCLRSFLSEIGLESELIWSETKTGFYTDGQLYSMSNSLEFLLFPPLGLIDKARLATTILYASRIKDWRMLEKIPVASWLKKWSGQRTFDKIWLPLLRAKLGENYQKTSAAFIWSTIQRMYAARRSGLKKEMFGYVAGGYAKIIDRIAHTLRNCGVELRENHSITQATPHKNGIQLSFSNGYSDTFQRAVFTMASPVAAQVCPDLSHSEIAQHNGIEYQGILCLSLLLKRPISNYYVTNITDDGVPFTAVIEMSALVDRHRFFGGHSLVYLPKYVTADDPITKLNDKQIEDLFISGLLKMHPQIFRSDIITSRLSRVRYVVALPTIGYSERLPPIHTSIPGLHIVNSAHILNSTLNVNETMLLAETAAKEILQF
jgi:protoporphyrinogen oxidase